MSPHSRVPGQRLSPETSGPPPASGHPPATESRSLVANDRYALGTKKSLHPRTQSTDVGSVHSHPGCLPTTGSLCAKRWPSRKKAVWFGRDSAKPGQQGITEPRVELRRRSVGLRRKLPTAQAQRSCAYLARSGFPVSRLGLVIGSSGLNTHRGSHALSVGRSVLGSEPDGSPLYAGAVIPAGRDRNPARAGTYTSGSRAACSPAFEAQPGRVLTGPHGAGPGLAGRRHRA